LFSRATRAEFNALRKELQTKQYDIVLDAQGLVKSAFLSCFANGVRSGLDFKSARETLAAIAYQKRYEVNFYQHAVVRMRSLFSQALSYALPSTQPEFGLNKQTFLQKENAEKYIVFLHGTTWASKQWPEMYWMQLAQMAMDAGYRIKISGGSAEEMQRAERIAKAGGQVDVIPYLDIVNMAALLAHATAAVTVDTGFGHLAAALDVPTVSLYGSTNPAYTGALGKNSMHLSAQFACAPCYNRTCKLKEAAEVKPACYTTLKPAQVWEAVNMVRS
jgi:heptosyltransferase-1